MKPQIIREDDITRERFAWKVEVDAAWMVETKHYRRKLFFFFLRMLGRAYRELFWKPKLKGGKR